MRVVSQNQDYSFDFDRTVFWTQYNIIYAKIGAESIAIGKYESDERAKEVFRYMNRDYDVITSDVKTFSSVFYMPEE